MKRVLVTGINSYIGTSFIHWADMLYKQELEIETVDLKDEKWRKKDFSSFDTILYVAGIAHADVGNVSEEEKARYYKINRDLTLDVARKCKSDGIKQFVFMSSMIVYGKNSVLGNRNIITKDTLPNPQGFYGESKLQAEKGLQHIQDESFQVAIVRSPMVYGLGCKGNYSAMSKIAKTTFIFPDYKNERSMIHIDNLCEFLCLLLFSNQSGIYFPQNEEYVQTVDMIRKIAQLSEHKILVTKKINSFVKLAGVFPGKISGLTNKAFGSLVYEKTMSNHFDGKYRIRNFDESIKLTEGC